MPGKIEVSVLNAGTLAGVETYLRGLPSHSFDWDRSLSAESGARLARFNIEKELEEGGSGFVATDRNGVCGVCTLVPDWWNSDYFGLKMCRVGTFSAPLPEAAGALSAKLNEAIRRGGFRHAHFAMDTGERDISLALQRRGWRVVWGSMRMVCETARAGAESFPLREGSLEVVDYEGDHLRPLLDIAFRLPDFSWLAFEESLPSDRRGNYKTLLVENSCEKGFADVALTLLRDGRPVGLNASKLLRHPPEVGKTRYTDERVTFIAPEAAGRGYGAFFERAVVKRLSLRVEYITGRVRLHEPAMFHIVQNAGFRNYRGEYLLVLDM